ncbi:MAG TPA: hypothetical protein VFC29_09430 [Candidatus Limnocylindrales bacterium]|jgi:hypothetical protein|nr:hypothetical protein [Candidatus Limnocylindrales bacterium]
MNKIPFSVYDFFAYLSSGAVVLTTIDYVWGLGVLRRKEVGPVLGIALVILAYVTGQIVAQFSSFLFEHIIVKRVLQRPLTLLLGAKPHWIVFAWLFPNFHRAFPEAMQQRIKEQAASRSCTLEGEGLFLHAYSVVTASERAQARLDDFRNQYGFARNMSFAFLVSTIAIILAHFYGEHRVHLRWSILAGFAAITLFYRYLKFVRQFSYELFLRYAELPRS